VAPLRICAWLAGRWSGRVGGARVGLRRIPVGQQRTQTLAAGAQPGQPIREHNVFCDCGIDARALVCVQLAIEVADQVRITRGVSG
jgi:hypothetical protein